MTSQRRSARVERPSGPCCPARRSECETAVRPSSGTDLPVVSGGGGGKPRLATGPSPPPSVRDTRRRRRDRPALHAEWTLARLLVRSSAGRLCARVGRLAEPMSSARESAVRSGRLVGIRILQLLAGPHRIFFRRGVVQRQLAASDRSGDRRLHRSAVGEHVVGRIRPGRVNASSPAGISTFGCE